MAKLLLPALVLDLCSAYRIAVSTDNLQSENLNATKSSGSCDRQLQALASQLQSEAGCVKAEELVKGNLFLALVGKINQKNAAPAFFTPSSCVNKLINFGGKSPMFWTGFGSHKGSLEQVATAANAKILHSKDTAISTRFGQLLEDSGVLDCDAWDDKKAPLHVASMAYANRMEFEKVKKIYIAVNKPWVGEWNLSASIFWKHEIVTLSRSLLFNPLWNPTIHILDGSVNGDKCGKKAEMIAAAISTVAIRQVIVLCSECDIGSMSNCLHSRSKHIVRQELITASNSCAKTLSGHHDDNFQPHGQGNCFYTSGLLYEGGFKHGLPHGRGVISYWFGDTVEGQWDHGRRQGQFTVKHPSGITPVTMWESILMVSSDGALKLPSPNQEDSVFDHGIRTHRRRTASRPDAADKACLGYFDMWFEHDVTICAAGSKYRCESTFWKEAGSCPGHNGCLGLDARWYGHGQQPCDASQTVKWTCRDGLWFGGGLCRNGHVKAQGGELGRTACVGNDLKWYQGGDTLCGLDLNQWTCESGHFNKGAKCCIGTDMRPYFTGWSGCSMGAKWECDRGRWRNRGWCR